MCIRIGVELINTFTPLIKSNFCGLNVMYHNYSSPGMLQLPWCATTSQQNVTQLPIEMHNNKLCIQCIPVTWYVMTPETHCTEVELSLYVGLQYRILNVGSNLLVIH